MIVHPNQSLAKSQRADLTYDICILGSGPAGILCALELTSLNPDLRICLIESGGLSGDTLNQTLNEGENRSRFLNFAEDPGVSRIRGLGGTTAVWGGYLAPLDEENFREKPWMPNSGWPIERTDLDPYYDRAARYFRVDPQFDVDFWIDESIYPVAFPNKPLTEKLWRFNAMNSGKGHLSRLSQSKQIDLFLGTTCLTLENNKVGAITAANCVRAAESCRFLAPIFVLALGGLENARFLLNVTKQSPCLMPSTRRSVGRYFTTHPILFWGSLLLTGDILKSDLYFRSTRRNGTGVPKGFLKVPEDIRKAQQWNDAHFEFAWPVREDIAAQWLPIKHLLSQENKVYELLGLTTEMHTRYENHVGLTDSLDSLGQNQLYFDLSVDKQTFESAHEQLLYFAEAIGANGYGRVKLKEQDIRDTITGQNKFWGGHHHMCTTRMSSSSADGVVDKNCRVHDCENLYVLGSSSFSSGGAANPTYTIGALAVRLSSHIKDRF